MSKQIILTIFNAIFQAFQAVSVARRKMASMSHSSDCEDTTPVVAGLFVNVKMEMNDSDCYEEEENGDLEESDVMNRNSDTSVDLTLPPEGISRPKGIIAKL